MASNLNWSLLGGIPQQWGNDAGSLLEMDSSKMKEGFDAVNALTDRMGRMHVRDKNSVGGLRDRLHELEMRKAELQRELMSARVGRGGFGALPVTTGELPSTLGRTPAGYSETREAGFNDGIDYVRTLGVV